MQKITPPATVVLVAATTFEVQPTLDHLRAFPEVRADTYASGQLSVTPLITGAGMLPTAFALQELLHRSAPRLVLHAGVAGSYDRTVPIGSVLEITTETVADLGIEERDGSFTPLHEQAWYTERTPFERGLLTNPNKFFDHLPNAAGRTLNRVTGAVVTIERLPKLDRTVESMEGAGVFYVCRRLGQPFASLRAVSNYVEPRNRAGWNMPLAIEQLNGELIRFLDGLRTTAG